MPIKVAIVEDNTSLRKRFVEQLSFYKDIKLIDAFATGEAALAGIKKLPPSRQPSIVLMDIALPKMSGIDVTIALKELYSDIDVMMITVFEDEARIFQAIQAGASGYLLKDDAPDKVVEAIRDLAKGGAPMSQSVARKLLSFTRAKMESANANLSRTNGSPMEFNLSERERELLDGLVKGETYTSLAKRHCISPHTVKTHIKNIYKKLHVHSRATAVRVALQQNLV